MSDYALTKFTTPNAGVSVSRAGTDISTTAALGLAIENIDTNGLSLTAAQTFTALQTLSGGLAVATVKDTSGNVVLTITAGGGIQIGAPTGGDKGSGTINATTFYANGSAVGAATKLGSGTATSNQSITSTASPGTDVTGLSVTCTPDGTHDVKITVCIPDMDGITTSGAFVAIQKDGTIVNTLGVTPTGTAYRSPIVLVHIDPAPTNASHTYKVSIWGGAAGTISTIAGDGTAPTNLILLEQIG